VCVFVCEEQLLACAWHAQQPCLRLEHVKAQARHPRVRAPVSSRRVLALKQRSSWDSLQPAFFNLVHVCVCACVCVRVCVCVCDVRRDAAQPPERQPLSTWVPMHKNALRCLPVWPVS
jgi:hypothetical protein